MIASNEDIPTIISDIYAHKTIPIYVANIILTSSLALYWKLSFDRDEIWSLVILKRNVLIEGRTRRVNTTIPTPPIKCVDERQKRIPLGRDSTSVRMVAPVVVKPDTDSKKAFVNVKFPPHIRYGSIPNIQESNHANIVMAKPSAIFISSVCLTNMRGKIPAMVVMDPLISKGANEESIPLKTDTSIDRSIKTPLKISVNPKYLDISFIFMFFF